MSAWMLGYTAVQKKDRTAELQAQLDETRRQLNQHIVRDELAYIRLHEYGPMLIRMFDEGREHQLELTSNRNISVTSTDRYDIVVDNDLEMPRLILRATGNPEQSCPESIVIDLKYNPGSDFWGEDFEQMEDWFTHLLTGTPVDHERNTKRWQEACDLAPSVQLAYCD